MEEGTDVDSKIAFVVVDAAADDVDVVDLSDSTSTADDDVVDLSDSTSTAAAAAAVVVAAAIVAAATAVVVVAGMWNLSRTEG